LSAVRPRTLLAACALSAAVAVACAGVPFATAAKPASGPNVKSVQAEGTKQAKKFLTLLKGADTPELRAFLASGFLLQRADGSFATKTDYLKAVTNVKSFTIDRVKASLQGTTLVVRYFATTDQIVDGQAYKRDPAPRLSTFVWTAKRGWQLIAHANFNTPVAS
jgi:hypothetical protein